MLREMPPQVLEGNAELLCRGLERRAGSEDVVQPSTIWVLAHTTLKWSAAPAARARPLPAPRSLRAVRWWRSNASHHITVRCRRSTTSTHAVSEIAPVLQRPLQ